MANKNLPITPYVRAPLPTLPESQRSALMTELQKLQRTLSDVTEAIADLQKRVTALNG